MKTKQKGNCPFCEKQVSAVVLEENKIRRDRCQCPSCEEVIFLCRVPGCNDYAKGTSVYDHELCPSCTEKVEAAAKVSGKVVLEVAKAIAIAVIAGKLGLPKKGK